MRWLIAATQTRCCVVRFFCLGFLLVCLSFTAAKEVEDKEVDEPCPSAAAGVATPKTSDQWKGLLPLKKGTILNRIVSESAGAKAGIHFVSSVRVTTIKLDSWQGEVVDPYAKWMIRAAMQKSEGQPKVAIPGFALVGDPSVVIQVFRLLDGTVIGGQVTLRQQGAFKVGAEYTTFEDIAQAQRKGYETRGRFWGLGFVFDEKGEVKNGTPMWSWQGR